MYSPIQPAILNWQQTPWGEIPISTQFGDVYYSREHGLQETEYVYLQGNNLAERLAQLPEKTTFTVGEIGFGTGLNLLALWQLWQNIQSKQPPSHSSWLHYISFEKHPLSKTDLSRALQPWHNLQQLSAQLLAQYPYLVPGVHRLIYPQDRLSIDLWLGDACDAVPCVHTTQPVNAWFLDGFAPSCNPQLWQEHIFKHIFRLSGPSTTFSSFSVAGVVKRALQTQGIHISRPKGFGHKREMLKAIWPKPQDVDCEKSDHNDTFVNTIFANTINDAPIAIIGAGIAGLSCAYSLALRGFKVHLYDKAQPLAEGSGNPQALITPKFTSIKNVAHHLHIPSFFAVVRWWNYWASQVVFKQTVVHLNTSKQSISAEKLEGYPTDVAYYKAAKTTNECNTIENTKESTYEHTHNDVAQNFDGLPTSAVYIPSAATLSPHALAKHILGHPNICFIQQEIKQLIPHPDNSNTTYKLNSTNADINYDKVIVCTAKNAHLLCPSLPKLNTIRGQVSWVNHTQLQLNQHDIDNTPLSYGGYCIPTTNTPLFDAQMTTNNCINPNENETQPFNKFLFGASFVRKNEDSTVLIEDHLHNAQLLQQALPHIYNALPNINTWQGRASVRAQTKDYLPLVGAINTMPNVYVLAGLGSKGFCFAPLCAEVICAQITKTALPITQQLQQQIDANRFSPP